MRLRRCDTCRYWHPFGTARGRGVCCHAPPIVFGYGDTVDVDWPHVDADLWCGRHKFGIANSRATVATLMKTWRRTHGW